LPTGEAYLPSIYFKLSASSEVIISLDKGLRDHEFFGRWQRSVLAGSEGVDTAELLRLSCLDYLPAVFAFAVCRFGVGEYKLG